MAVEKPVTAETASAPAEASVVAEEAKPAEVPAPVEEVKPAEAPAEKAELAPAPSPEAPAVPDDVADLPAYPGASRSKLDTSTVGSDGWSRKVKVELDTRDTFENVKRFYEKVIQDRGWKVTGISEQAEKVGWKLAKDSSVAEVRIDKEGHKRVKIRLERKDR